MNLKTLTESIQKLEPGDWGTLKDILADMLEVAAADPTTPEPAEGEN